MDFNGFISTFDYQSYLNRDNLLLLMVLMGTILAVLAIGIMILGVGSPLKRKVKSLNSGSDIPHRSERFSSAVENMAPMMIPNSKKERDSVQLQLLQAGFQDASSLPFFYATKLVTILIGIFAAIASYILMSDSSYMPLMIILSLSIGMFGPNMMLAKLVSERKSRIKAAVPDALDLLVVCTESGLGFNAALKRVSGELVISHPDLAYELDTVCAKIQAGIEMPVAFRELVDGTGVEELSGLVTMLSHAAKVGGSIAQTLRDYTEDYRDKRTQEAEEVAAKIPTKMLFPMVIFIWPCFFIVALGPGLMTLFDALK